MRAPRPLAAGACLGATLVALFVGEDRAEAPLSFVRSASAAAAIAREPEATAEPEKAEAHGEGRALKLHLRNGNDVVRKNTWVYVPRAFDPSKKLHVAIIFHGFKNCIDSYVSPGGLPCREGEEQRTGYDIPAQVDKSGTGALFVVPQLAFDEKSSDPGKLGKIGGLRRFVKELVEEALVPYVGPHAYEDVERVMLLASSGGYEALVPALTLGQVERVRDVYLLDAFYVDNAAMNGFLREHPEDFRPDAKDPRHFGLVFCRKSGTARQSREFGERLGQFMEARGNAPFFAYDGASHRDRSGPALDDLRVPAFVYMSRLEHDQVVSRYLWQFLAVSGI